MLPLIIVPSPSFEPEKKWSSWTAGKQDDAIQFRGYVEKFRRHVVELYS